MNKYILKQTHYFTLIILLCALGTSCDAVRSAKRKVKSVLFGVKLEENTSNSETSSDDTDSSSNTDEGGSSYKDVKLSNNSKSNLKTIEVSPKEKILNLCAAYAQQSDPTIKGLLMRSIHDNGKIFNNSVSDLSVDPDLESCLLKLDAIVSNGGDRAVDVMNILFEFHVSLKGKNHEAVDKVWATSIDNIPYVFFKKVAGNLDYKNCPWGSLLPVKMDEARKRDFLLERRGKLVRVINSEKFRNTTLEKFFIQNCIQRIDKDLGGGHTSKSFNNKKEEAEQVTYDESKIETTTTEDLTPSQISTTPSASAE